jgi:hypothetical protein
MKFLKHLNPWGGKDDSGDSFKNKNKKTESRSFEQTKTYLRDKIAQIKPGKQARVMSVVGGPFASEIGRITRNHEGFAGYSLTTSRSQSSMIGGKSAIVSGSNMDAYPLDGLESEIVNNMQVLLTRILSLETDPDNIASLEIVPIVMGESDFARINENLQKGGGVIFGNNLAIDVINPHSEHTLDKVTDKEKINNTYGFMKLNFYPYDTLTSHFKKSYVQERLLRSSEAGDEVREISSGAVEEFLKGYLVYLNDLKMKFSTPIFQEGIEGVESSFKFIDGKSYTMCFKYGKVKGSNHYDIIQTEKIDGEPRMHFGEKWSCVTLDPKDLIILYEEEINKIQSHYKL